LRGENFFTRPPWKKKGGILLAWKASSPPKREKGRGIRILTTTRIENAKTISDTAIAKEVKSLPKPDEKGVGHHQGHEQRQTTRG